MEHQRAHPRFNVYHLGFLSVMIERKSYAVVDICQGGISVVGEFVNKIPSRKLVFKGIEFHLGDKLLKLDCEFVHSSDKDISSFKFLKYHGKSESLLKEFLQNIEIGMLFVDKDESGKSVQNGIEFILSEEFWSINTGSFYLIFDGESCEFKEKGLLTSKGKILSETLSYVTGLPKKVWRTDKMAHDIVQALKQLS